MKCLNIKLLLSQIFKAEMLISLLRDAASARRARQEAALEKIRLIYVLKRYGFLVDGRRKRFKSHRAAVKLPDYGSQYIPVGYYIGMQLLYHLPSQID